jgi:Rod binding domain-containing protein
VSSSVSVIAPPVSLADVRGTQAANKLKDANSGVDSDQIKKSAREFEAVLLSHWLEQAEQSFATVPGSEEDQDAVPGHDQFQAIAVQAIATSLSGRSGGLGIASLVTKHLETATERQYRKDIDIK